MSGLQVKSLDIVSADLRRGAQFYDQIETGLGTYFLDSISADIESLQIFGGVHSQVFGFHRMPAKRFPYSIYYHLLGNTVIVVGVLAMRKDPGKLQSDLSIRT